MPQDLEHPVLAIDGRGHQAVRQGLVALVAELHGERVDMGRRIPLRRRHEVAQEERMCVNPMVLPQDDRGMRADFIKDILDGRLPVPLDVAEISVAVTRVLRESP